MKWLNRVAEFLMARWWLNLAFWIAIGLVFVLVDRAEWPAVEWRRGFVAALVVAYGVWLLVMAWRASRPVQPGGPPLRYYADARQDTPPSEEDAPQYRVTPKASGLSPEARSAFHRVFGRRPHL